MTLIAGAIARDEADLSARAPSGPEGFSLIEMLVVIAITSVLAVGATLGFSRSGPSAETAAAEFSTITGDARLGAMLSGVPHALQLDGTGWRIEWREAGGWTGKGGGDWDVGVTIDESATASRRILFSPDGRVSPFSIRFASVMRCGSDSGEAPSCRRL